MSKIKDAIMKIQRKQNELTGAIQELERLLVYSHFDDGDIPRATISNDYEVFLEYRGLELDSGGIEHYMKVQGYITPAEFH